MVEEFEAEYARKVFGIPDVKGVVSGFLDEVMDRKTRGRRPVRRVDEVWPVGRGVSRLASKARTSLLRCKDADDPMEALKIVLTGEPRSPSLRSLKVAVEGRGPIGLPSFLPELTPILWGVRDASDLEATARGLVSGSPVVRTVALAVLDAVGETLVEELDEAVEGLSNAFRRAMDHRGVKLTALCVAAWMSRELDGFETWWREGGGWRRLYSEVREARLIEGVVEERLGIRFE